MQDPLHYLQLASSHFLITTLPDNWYDITVKKQNEFIAENAWEPFQNTDPVELLDHIHELSATLRGVAWAEREATLKEVKATILKPFAEAEEE